MMSPTELAQFAEQGFLHVASVLTGAELERVRNAHDEVRQKHPAPWHQLVLLQYEVFIDLFQYAPIVDRVGTVFGDQLQLLQYDLLYQGPHHSGADRAWHRDFYFPGDYPVSINAIVYLDEIGDDGGPTYAVPGSHRGTELPPRGAAANAPLPGEVAVRASAGDVLFINSAIWHSGGINHSERQRRNIYIYYGYWWLKRYEYDRQLPWQASVNADARRLQLLGLAPAPGSQLHMYLPTGAFDQPSEEWKRNNA